MAQVVEMGMVNSSGTLTVMYPKTDWSGVVCDNSQSLQTVITSLRSSISGLQGAVKEQGNALTNHATSISNLQTKTESIECVYKDKLTLGTMSGTNPTTNVYVMTITLNTNDYVSMDYPPLFVSVMFGTQVPASGYGNTRLTVSGPVMGTSSTPNYSQRGGISFSTISWYMNSSDNILLTLSGLS